MKRVRITLKNYRGFADSDPVTVEIDSGFTALLGRNNSGKSAFKLFFYEFRHFFEILGRDTPDDHPNVYIIFRGGFNTSYQGLTDVQEIFHNGNDRPITVEIDILNLS